MKRESSEQSPGQERSTLRSNPTVRLLVLYVGLLLLVLALSASFLRPNWCGVYFQGCMARMPEPLLSGTDILPSDAVRATTQGQSAEMWLELGNTGVFTPTTTSSGTVVRTDDGQTIRYLDDLATQGYIAIRVPHAPPTYTPSSLIPGILPLDPDPVKFSYYAPPSAPELTTVPVTLTRRADLEAIVNAQYPINDGQSHWEVWWLPAGETFPIPDQPFRLDADSWPPPLAVRFQIDFGSGVSAFDCAGCPIEVLVYNGHLFIGPHATALRYTDTTIRDPLVSFGAHCTFQATPLFPSVGQYITPTVPFTHTYCLENWDTVSRTFTIDALSSEAWPYTYYRRGTEFGAVLIPAGDPPFNVEVGPRPLSVEPGTLGLLAVYTPTITVSDTMRETLYLTATSTVSPGVRASSLSVALAPAYALEEGVQPPQILIYLPLILRNYP